MISTQIPREPSFCFETFAAFGTFKWFFILWELKQNAYCGFRVIPLEMSIQLLLFGKLLKATFYRTLKEFISLIE